MSSALDPSPSRPSPSRPSPSRAGAAAPSPPATSDAEAQVQARLAELDGLEGLALALHAELYETLHTELQEVLAEIDGA